VMMFHVEHCALIAVVLAGLCGCTHAKQTEAQLLNQAINECRAAGNPQPSIGLDGTDWWLIGC